MRLVLVNTAISVCLCLSAAVAASGCVFDQSGMALPDNPNCGNDVVDDGEECDGEDLDGVSCEQLGYEGGRLSCTSECRFDTDECEGPAPRCGNGVVDPGESCDGNAMEEETCVTLGHAGGVLKCADDCTFDIADCVNQLCGNDRAEGTEECDGRDLDGKDCETLGHGGGTLRCTGNCKFDVTGCGATCESTPLSCGTQVSDTMLEAVNTLSGYSCSTHGGGGDRVYAFVAPRSGTVTASLGCEPFDDLDLYILEGSCNPQACTHVGLESGGENVSFPVTAGTTYYVVVEAYQIGFAGIYNLFLSCP